MLLLVLGVGEEGVLGVLSRSREQIRFCFFCPNQKFGNECVSWYSGLVGVKNSIVFILKHGS